ncbi:lysostaphin resistance A-like protein [Lacisediminihabitans sp. FW035]
MTSTMNREFVSRRNRPTVPGWPEMLAGALTYGASYLLVAVLLPLIEDEGVAGVAGFVVSGLMGIIALAVAAVIRIRGLSAFGFRRTKVRYLVLGAAFGLVAFVLGTVIAVVYAMLIGEPENVQGSYQAAAAGGVLSLVVTLVAGSLITPLGEESLFRGVFANGLMARFGPLVGIIASAAIFALAHGINPVFPIAFVVGILAAVLFRWSGSIWPGIMLHGVNNATVALVPVIIAAGAAK